MLIIKAQVRLSVTAGATLRYGTSGLSWCPKQLGTGLLQSGPGDQSSPGAVMEGKPNGSSFLQSS